jgi:hypothetical protein
LKRIQVMDHNGCFHRSYYTCGQDHTTDVTESGNPFNCWSDTARLSDMTFWRLKT